MDELKQDIKDIKSDVVELKIIAAANTSILAEHMKRTELNEKRIQTLEYFIMGGTMSILGILLKISMS